MATEVERVSRRCVICGMAVEVVIRDTTADEEGERVVAIYATTLPHKIADCDTMQRLQREQWPVLPLEGF